MHARNTPTELAALGPLIDSVTGLPGRALFFDHLQLALAQLERNDTCAAVLIVDVDDFKLINDGLGPDTGDAVLAALGRRLLSAIRPADTLARLSADEFAVICPDIGDARDAFAVAERVGEFAADPFAIDGHEVFLTVSTGVSLALSASATASEMVRDAAAALHEAKERGPGSSELFDMTLRARLLERLSVEAGLRRALDRGELRLHYQPEVEIATGRIAAVEALVRWEHPERGLLEPGEFIGVAERSGLIVPVGSWVLETACCQAREWMDVRSEPVQMAVNVSARQIEQPRFFDTVVRALAVSGLPAEALCLEVTESAVMANPKAALSVLAAAKTIGVKIAIDDFGVGFSSLGQLRDLLPIHQLKIDRSFIAQIGDDQRSRAIVGAVVMMATALGLEAVAEGVEDAHQLAELSALGCDLGQGYYLARPEPPEAIPGLLGEAPAVHAAVA